MTATKNKHNNLYMINNPILKIKKLSQTESALTITESYNTWHYRLGHLSLTLINSKAKNQSVSKMEQRMNLTKIVKYA